MCYLYSTPVELWMVVVNKFFSSIESHCKSSFVCSTTVSHSPTANQPIESLLKTNTPPAQAFPMTNYRPQTPLNLINNVLLPSQALYGAMSQSAQVQHGTTPSLLQQTKVLNTPSPIGWNVPQTPPVSQGYNTSISGYVSHPTLSVEAVSNYKSMYKNS